ncbi:MAG: hypothetical protein R3F14_20130 [Polyangiaceae bacterium]
MKSPVPLGGAPLKAAVGQHTVHVAVEIDDQVTLVTVHDTGAVVRLPLGVSPTELTFWLASPQGTVFFGKDTGAGIVAMSVRPEESSPQSGV